jgi:hypothetical protein
MTFADYAIHHVGCIIRVLRGDPDGLSDMDISADGFWRSFRAIPIALPALFFAWVVQGRELLADGVAGSLGSLILRMAALELVLWILPLIALAIVLKPLGMAHRFSHIVIARNWFSVIISYVFVVAPLASLILGVEEGAAAENWIVIAVMMFTLWAATRVTRVALDTTPTVAIAFVVVETLITIPLALSLYGMAGLNPAV